MSKSEIIKNLKLKNPNISKPVLESVFEDFCNCMENSLLEKKNIELRGFGTFFIKKIKEKYSARNPLTGEIIYIPEKNKVRFKASKKLKNLINK